MANAVEKSCTMLVHSAQASSAAEIKDALEGNDAEAKVMAMKKAVVLLLNGEQLPQLFITIVRYVLPSEDHTVQKLLLLYLVRYTCMQGPVTAGSGAVLGSRLHSPLSLRLLCRRPLRRQIPLASCFQRW